MKTNSPQSQYQPSPSPLGNLEVQPLDNFAMLKQQANDAAGFSWLSVLVILGLIGGAAWWAFAQTMIVGCGGASIELEGRTYVSALGRGQQAFFLDHNHFSSDFDALGLGLEQKTETYHYKTVVRGDRAFNYAVAQEGVTESFIGAVFALDTPTSSSEDAVNNPEFATILCSVEIKQDEEPIDLATILPTLDNNIPNCHPNSYLIGRSPQISATTYTANLYRAQ